MRCRLIVVFASIASMMTAGGCFQPESATEESSTRQHATALVRWGDTWAAAGDLDQALSGYDEALQIDPDYIEAYSRRASLWERKGEPEKALADISEAIQRAPQDFQFQLQRRYIWGRCGQWDKVIEDYKDRTTERSNDAIAWNDLAWALATCPDARFRNAPEAVRYAHHACELSGYKDGNILDTLAAAYADNDEFDKAIETQKLALGRPQFVHRHAKEARARLVLYEQHKAYRESPPGLFQNRVVTPDTTGSAESK